MILLALVIIVIAITTMACSTIYTPPLRVSESATLQQRMATLEHWLQTLYDSRRFSGTVLIGNADRIIFSKSFGFEDPENTRPITDRSAFNLASVSKQFTALAVLLLEHEEKLSVTDKLSDHLPELAIYPDVTIDKLLHHTSGITDYISLAMKQGADNTLFTTSDLISLFSEQRPPLEFDPGTKFRYSNTGYVLLAEIVARASGLSFEEYMLENVFRPAGMEDSQAFNRLSTNEPKNRVLGFKRKRLDGGKSKLHDLNNLDGVIGDGGIYASARDLHRWHQVLLTGKLLPNSMYGRATTSGVLADGSETDYGYGWFLRNKTIVEHAGGWVGFSSYIYRDLSTGELIVILDNSTNALRVGTRGFRFTSIGLNLIDFVESLSE